VVDEDTGTSSVADEPASEATRTQLHRTIAAVRDGYEHLRVNVAIAKLVELNNHLTKLGATPSEVAEPLVLMVAPVVPHIAEELWRILGHDDTVAREPFPVADADFLVDDLIELPVQVNGRVRARITVAADADDETVTSAALADDKVTATIDGATPRKVIVVPGRMVNVVV
ncbi:MAG: class I tRNA ligase family protein, partial [Actinomycetota bacterium]|nr:class I tRNA ligase family protein [Actinomycetota bacterium]